MPCRSRGATLDRMDDRIQRVGNTVVVTAAQVQGFLHTPAGRKFRRYLAGGLILTAPLLFRIPGLRRLPFIRVLEAIGGAALLVKMAEALRDWERGGEHGDRIIIQVPPVETP
jgi:hypothetical protein